MGKEMTRMSNFTNSPLIVHTRLSPNRNSPRNQPIRKITIHHWAGVSTIENIGAFLANADRQASYNYGIGNDGRIALYVNERDRCWASSSGANDHQAVVIGVSNSATGGEWPVGERALASLIDLCVDICQRNPDIRQANGQRGLTYNGTASGSLTRHNFFAKTTCPGQFLQNLFPWIADEVNRRLNPPVPVPVPTPVPPPTPEIPKEDEDMTPEKFTEMFNAEMARRNALPGSDWSKDARDWAVETGLFAGDGKGNFMWQGLLTREQAATLFFNKQK
jgi:hypothetical protein